MNPNIRRLYDIAKKPQRTIIGLMSGTSLDGLDIALCRITGNGNETKMELLQFETIPYADDLKQEVRSVFSKKMVDLEKLCLLHPWLALQHASMINSCLQKWKIAKENVDLVASHGQTIYHAPATLHGLQKFGNATLQIGDADHLAVATGIITISDMRQKNIAAGGEGAPLAVYADHLLFSKNGEDRILLNIGGIANFTYLPGDRAQNILCTDVGPGNTMMDTFMQQHFPGKFFDENGSTAASGKVNHDLLSALKQNDFFDKPLPRSTGPELFNMQYLRDARKRSNTENISEADTMATLNRFSAEGIADAISNSIPKGRTIKIFSSGGGMHNPVLMGHLSELLPNCEFSSSASQGVNPDAKEAILFALLANECVSGTTATFEKMGAGIPAVSMGKISFPA